MPSQAATEEYCTTGIAPAAPWRIHAVSVQSGYRLAVTCNDGTTGVVDMATLVHSPDAGIYAALKDVGLFQRVSLELGVLTWPNGADLDPAWVHEEIGKSQVWSVPA